VGGEGVAAWQEPGLAVAQGAGAAGERVGAQEEGGVRQRIEGDANPRAVGELGPALPGGGRSDVGFGDGAGGDAEAALVEVRGAGDASPGEAGGRVGGA